jgi:hypothetical protein
VPAVACKGLLTVLPADIRLVGGPELERFMPIHVVTMLSPCQGLSRANRNGRGLADHRLQLIGDDCRSPSPFGNKRADPTQGGRGQA